MNYRTLNVYRAPAGDDGDAGGGDTAVVVKPEDARAQLTEFGHGADALKAMPDADVLKLHGTVSGATAKQIKAAGEKSAAEQAKVQKANVEKWTKGEIKLEVPKDSKLSQVDVDKVAAIARERGLSQEQAAELLTLRADAITQYEAAAPERIKTLRADWVKQITADPEIGGEKLAETQKIVMRPIERFMSPELRKELRATGLGDHPLFVKFLHSIGSVMSEDKPGDVKIGAGGGEKKDPATVLYGDPAT